MHLVLAVAVAFSLLLASGSADAARRIALVIGNEKYENLTQLTKAASDARTYATVLKAKGFDQVILKVDLTRSEMDEAIAGFIEQIRPGDVAVFAYSGHGWSDGRENFLIGTEAPETGSQEYLTRVSVPLRNGRNGIVDDMHRRGAALKVAIVDACRSNPFKPQAGMKAVGQLQGLSEVDTEEGEFIIFAAGTGQVSLDRLNAADENPNSVFTRVFVPLLEREDSLLDAVKAAQREVVKLAQTVSVDQRPTYFDGVVGDPCLSGDCDSASTLVPIAAAEPPPSIDVSSAADVVDDTAIGDDYRLAERVNTGAGWDAFLAKYGSHSDNFYVQLASAARQKLSIAIAEPAPTIVEPQLTEVPPTETPLSAGPLLEDRIRLFVLRYLNSWSSPNQIALDELDIFYDSRVYFYGGEILFSDLYHDKQRFALRWPIRRYEARPETIEIDCQTSGRCTIDMIVDWDTRSNERNAQSKGAAEFSLGVSYNETNIKINSENGRVISK